MSIYDVSSAFIDKCLSNAISMRRRLWIGSDSHADNVITWPSIRRDGLDTKFTEASVTLSNHDGTFDHYRTEPWRLGRTCRLEVGVEFTTSSYEYINVFEGSISNLSYGRNGTEITLKLANKFKQLGERVAGTATAPYTASSIPSEIAWSLVTSYGGLSSVASTSNPDIDYASFLSWAQVFSTDNLTVDVSFDGTKTHTALRKLLRVTDSAVVDENGKLRFYRWGSVNSGDAFEIPESGTIGGTCIIEDRDIVNTQIVNIGYNVGSGTYSAVVNAADSTSVNTYGLREDIEEDRNVWYTTSADGLNLAQRMVSFKKDPLAEFRINTGLQALGRQVGETVKVTHNKIGMAGDVMLITGYEFDMQSCEFTLDLRQGYTQNFFILDSSSYGLLDISVLG